MIRTAFSPIPSIVSFPRPVKPDGARKEHRDARTIRLRERSRWLRVIKVPLVIQLERLGGDEDNEDEGVRPEAAAPEIDRQPEHQYRGHLDAAQLGDRLEEKMQRRLPRVVHPLRDLHVEARERTRGDRDGQRDEDGAEDRDGDEAWD